jgi:hypothetical protein
MRHCDEMLASAGISSSLGWWRSECRKNALLNALAGPPQHHFADAVRRRAVSVSLAFDGWPVD